MITFNYFLTDYLKINVQKQAFFPIIRSISVLCHGNCFVKCHGRVSIHQSVPLAHSWVPRRGVSSLLCAWATNDNTGNKFALCTQMKTFLFLFLTQIGQQSLSGTNIIMHSVVQCSKTELNHKQATNQHKLTELNFFLTSVNN